MKITMKCILDKIKYTDIPEGYDIMNVNIETEYINYMKEVNNISIYNENNI